MKWKLKLELPYKNGVVDGTCKRFYYPTGKLMLEEITK